MSYHNPTSGNLLFLEAKYLKNCGHEITGHISDKYGKFAVKVKSKDSGVPFILTARGIFPWRGIVSIQSRLTREWKSLHVLGIWPEGCEKPSFYCFDNLRILMENEGFTMYRPDCEMINFKAYYGVAWDPGEDVELSWKLAKKSTESIMKSSLENWIH